MTGQYTFIVVGKKDNPLYEYCSSTKKEESSHFNQFIVHAALDIVETDPERGSWSTQNMYLKVVDKFNDQLISAFVTAGQVKFMLLHDGRNDESIRAFFTEVYSELYLKIVMNPFYDVNSPITSAAFDQRVKAIGRRYLQ